MNEWIVLGFCTCGDLREETALGGMYRDLLKRCTFEELWTAIHKSTITALIDSKGMKDRRHKFPRLELLLPNTRKIASVWYLKQFTMTDDTDPIEGVAVDYGFVHCSDARDRSELKTAYGKAFATIGCTADAVKLHEACLTNKIYEYLSTITQLDGRLAKLMQSPYPLHQAASHAALIFENVHICPESIKDKISLDDCDEFTYIKIPDSADKDMCSTILEKAALTNSVVRISKLPGDFEMCSLDMSSWEDTTSIL